MKYKDKVVMIGNRKYGRKYFLLDNGKYLEGSIGWVKFKAIPISSSARKLHKNRKVVKLYYWENSSMHFEIIC